MFNFIGWFIVFMLIGSVLYSAKFQISNYLLQKRKIRINVVSQTYADLQGNINWNSLITIQLVKTIIAIALIFLLIK